jgi:hypothetical protein
MTKSLVLFGASCAVLLSMAPAQADRADYQFYSRGYITELKKLSMMDMMDGNKDHMVSKEEFMAYQSRMFDMMDRNKDGMVDRSEWQGKLGGIGGKGTS